MTTLQPVPGTAGEFADPAYVPGTPGTFAVVVGVSAYRHLTGGPDAVPETFGLGQLHVSAATAHRFFCWLRDRYDFATAPLARCWLLLAPTPQELLALRAASTAELGAVEPTLAGCRAAIGSWWQAMQLLPQAAATQSRGIFFFSGHGVEIWQEKQILLPSDYLAPPLNNVNDAISTANLRMGLAASPVPSHYLFVDACRNDARRLRELNVDGQKILNEPLAAAINPDVLFGTLYAAASGTETWQPRELEQGYSVFGGSVIDGLEGADGLERQGCTERSCEVQFYPLETFVKARMAQVLQQFQSPEKVRVRNGGTPPDGLITAVPRVPVTSPEPADPGEPPAPGEAPPPGPEGPPAASPPVTVTPVLAARYDVHHEALWPVTGDWKTGHDLFGSELMTVIWQGAQLSRLEDRVPIGTDQIVVHEVSRSADTGAYRVTVVLPRGGRGHWLQVTDATGQAFGCALPGSERWYEFEIDFERGANDDRWIARMEVTLSPFVPGAVGRVARIWQTYQDQNAAAAADQFDLGLLEDAVRGKMASPLAATVAATVLLRAHRLDLLHRDWLRNLSDWFEALADPPVLWAEQLRLQDPAATTSLPERRLHLQRLLGRGLPMLAEVLPLAARQLAEPELAADPQLADLRIRMETALRYYRPGGMFAVFAGPAGVLGPALVS